MTMYLWLWALCLVSAHANLQKEVVIPRCDNNGYTFNNPGNECDNECRSTDYTMIFSLLYNESRCVSNDDLNNCAGGQRNFYDIYTKECTTCLGWWLTDYCADCRGDRTCGCREDHYMVYDGRCKTRDNAVNWYSLTPFIDSTVSSDPEDVFLDNLVQHNAISDTGSLPLLCGKKEHTSWVSQALAFLYCETPPSYSFDSRGQDAASAYTLAELTCNKELHYKNRWSTNSFVSCTPLKCPSQKVGVVSNLDDPCHL